MCSSFFANVEILEEYGISFNTVTFTCLYLVYTLRSWLASSFVSWTFHTLNKSNGKTPKDFGERSRSNVRWIHHFYGHELLCHIITDVQSIHRCELSCWMNSKTVSEYVSDVMVMVVYLQRKKQFRRKNWLFFSINPPNKKTLRALFLHMILLRKITMSCDDQWSYSYLFKSTVQPSISMRKLFISEKGPSEAQCLRHHSDVEGKMPLIKTSILLPTVPDLLSTPAASPSISRLIRADKIEAVRALASLQARAPRKF